MNPPPDWALALTARFEHIADTRMRGVPVLNPRLQVAAIGFAPHIDAAAPAQPGTLGILLTPWFMNLIWRSAADDRPLAPGASRGRRLGEQTLDFIGVDDELLGPYESCSLFSPVLEFADQASALATAEEVLRLLREPPAPSPPSRPVLNRRALLFGRLAGAGE